MSNRLQVAIIWIIDIIFAVWLMMMTSFPVWLCLLPIWGNFALLLVPYAIFIAMAILGMVGNVVVLLAEIVFGADGTNYGFTVSFDKKLDTEPDGK